MRQDEGIPYLVSKLKSDDIGPLFWPKKLENAQKLAKLPNLPGFDRFLAKKVVKYCPISILKSDLESSHPGASFRPQH